MASRNVTAVPRPALSGKPFNAKFTNIADRAGLHAPVIYGDPGRADYIQESIGCGVAFLDYDNDGWQDIVVLTGRRRTGPTPAEATIRQAMSRPFTVCGERLAVGASVGVVTARRGTDAETLLRQADAAMYAAKRARSIVGTREGVDRS